jgi:hypothetical protein
MTANYVFWRPLAGDKFCSVGALLGVPDAFEVTRGVSREGGFPADAHFEMNPRFPDQVALPDGLVNLDRLVVVSPTLRDFLADQVLAQLAQVELLPVTILNHKRRDSGAPYAIVNPLTIVDVIDVGASSLEWNSIDPTLICTCDQLVLKDGGVPGDPLLFRPKFLETRVLLRRDLADAIRAKGFTGISFVEIDAFEA